jgi:murein DD-endopeptidase MepM/ murein hydrolase activator NlpD
LLNKQITIIVAGFQEGRTYRLTLSRTATWLILAALGMIVGGLVLSLAMYFHAAAVASKAQALAMENASLTEGARHLADLQQEVDRLRSMEAKVLALMGVDTLAADRRKWEELGLTSANADSISQPEKGGFIWPVTGAISRGYRLDRASGAPHLGLDIAGETGTPVKAAKAGIVTFAGPDSVFGNMVIIDHGNGLTTLYGHNSVLLVSAGDKVELGQPIALLGSTGRSSAPHLHFEVREGESTVDPLKYLQRR